MESVESLPRVACNRGFCLLHCMKLSRTDLIRRFGWPGFLAFMEFILQKMSPLVGGNLVLQIKNVGISSFDGSSR